MNALALALLIAGGTCDVTELPASGTLTAERFNQRYRQVEACINGHIGNANIASTEPIALTNLQNQKADYAISWRLSDELAATHGGDLAAASDTVQWMIPVDATMVGSTMTLHGCTGCSVTLAIQKDAVNLKQYSAIATTTLQKDFVTTGTITGGASGNVLNIDISGTFTGVKYIDVVLFVKSSHQT